MIHHSHAINDEAIDSILDLRIASYLYLHTYKNVLMLHVVIIHIIMETTNNNTESRCNNGDGKIR